MNFFLYLIHCLIQNIFCQRNYQRRAITLFSIVQRLKYYKQHCKFIIQSLKTEIRCILQSISEEPLQIFDLQKIMYKDRYPAPHHLSYSAVTSYNTSVSNTNPYEPYQNKDTIEQFHNNNYRSSLKNEPNSDLAFLRNTVGPISSLNQNNNFLKLNDNKKVDVSLRQTMNVTSDLRERIKTLQNPLAKITSRAGTVNQAQLPSNTQKRVNKNDDRLEKIMDKYEKKNQTKQALKLLQELKQLKKKQEQLKKQRKNQTVREQQNGNKNNRTSYDYGSPVNFSKKNKVDYFTPTHDKNQYSTKTNSLQNQGIFNTRQKKNSCDFTRQQISINVNSNPYKVIHPIKDQLSSTMTIPQLSYNNKSTSNLKSQSYQNSEQNYKGIGTGNSYQFRKNIPYDEKNTGFNKLDSIISKKYSTNDFNIKNYDKTFKDCSYSNVLNVTTRDNTNGHNFSKSPNTKSYSSKSTNPDLLSSSVSYTSKTYSNYDTSDNSYSKKVQYDMSNSKKLYNSPKDIFAHRKVTIDDFILGKNLGQGKFGTVFQAFDKKTKSLYALKKVPKSIIKSHWMVDQFILEVKIQNFLNHPNILSLHGCFDDNQNVYILLEYMEEGTLFLHLKKNTTLCEKQAAIKLKQIASGIQYLHQNGIAHRDIKPENIVMSHGVCKLCDFGWATICDERRKTYCGTFDYAAPQILQGTQYDMSVDLWCLGILAYEILVGKAPFYHISRKQTMKKIMNCQNQKIHYPSTMSSLAKSFIEQLLRKNPEQRLKSEDLLKHPFFRLAEQ